MKENLLLLKDSLEHKEQNLQVNYFNIDKLYVIVSKYNNIYRSKIKIKPADGKSNTYISSSKEINDQDPIFKIGDIVPISKYKNIFAKCYVPNLSEEVFLIKKVICY